jgi:serine/threonine protein kinase
VKCFGVLESTDAKILVLEYIDGKPLGKLLSGARIPEGEVREIFFQVAVALAYLHGMNLTHMDVKPANSMVTDDLTVTLIDFGIVVAPDIHAPRISRSVGTLGYASPETVDRGVRAPPCDIWSLGLTLVHVISDVRPKQWCIADFISGRLKSPDPYSREFWELCRTMLVDNPSERITAAGIAERLALRLPNPERDRSSKVTVTFKRGRLPPSKW